PVANLHEVPDEVPDELAVFVEPLAAAYEILEQVAIPPKRAWPCSATASSARWSRWCWSRPAPR
ncbi:MAG TPA: hypothetical protein VIL20_30175, partial [Sandaracinaceae bacterium]